MKKLVSITILLFSALIIFNLCYFICVDYDGNTCAWICYLFFHLAYILSILGYIFTTRRRFVVLNNKLNTISFIYLTITIITCIIYLSITDTSKEFVIIVFLTELLLYLLSFHYCYLTNRKAEKGIINDLKKSSKHDIWIAELRLLINSINNEEKVKVIKCIIDEIRSCPSLSAPYVYEVDNEIHSLIKTLRLNYSTMSMSELLDFKEEIRSAILKRTELLRNSYHKV